MLVADCVSRLRSTPPWRRLELPKPSEPAVRLYDVHSATLCCKIVKLCKRMINEGEAIISYQIIDERKEFQPSAHYRRISPFGIRPCENPGIAITLIETFSKFIP